MRHLRRMRRETILWMCHGVISLRSSLGRTSRTAHVPGSGSPPNDGRSLRCLIEDKSSPRDVARSKLSALEECAELLMEFAKPVALVLCMLSLCAVFNSAFLVPASDLQQRAWDSLILLSLAVGICLSGGMIFRDSAQTLTRTLPVQMFFWAACLMLALFLASWYLETHCVFYKDVRRF